jgi:hypothetical protein
VPSTLSLPITLTFIQQHTIIYHHHHKQCAIYFQLQSDPRDSQRTPKSDRHQLRLGHQREKVNTGTCTLNPKEILAKKGKKREIEKSLNIYDAPFDTGN